MRIARSNTQNCKALLNDTLITIARSLMLWSQLHTVGRKETRAHVLTTADGDPLFHVAGPSSAHRQVETWNQEPNTGNTSTSSSTPSCSVDASDRQIPRLVSPDAGDG